ncbi:MAG: sporulation transcription factor Spo0A [Clostridia bacterium]|nr:sporulation transcription factor Spo0A [Clostridia bacterium]
MKRKSLILLDSNPAVLEQLQEEIAKSDEFHLLHIGDDGDEGIKKLMNEKPDLVITGMFLKGADGAVVTQTVKKTWPSTKVIAMGMANDGLIERALSLGVEYYLVKPFDTAVAMERIREILKETSKVEGKEFAAKKRNPVTIDEKISEIFISIGIPPHIKGYGYLREGVKLTVAKPQIINGVTKELYPSIAKKFATTSSKVERAIRHAIEVAWNRGRIDAINAIFGTRVYLGVEKPTNSEFIALVADKLILENML